MRIDEFSSSANINADLDIKELMRFMTFGFDIWTIPGAAFVMILPVLSSYELYLSVTSTDELVLDVRS